MTKTQPDSGIRGVAARLAALTTSDGYSTTALEQVQFMRASRAYPCVPVAYEPSIVIIAQGRKIGYLGGQEFVYDANNYLVLPVPLPFECATYATATRPLLGISITVEPVMIGELLLQMNDRTSTPTKVRGIYSTPLTSALTDATMRLLDCLASPIDSRVLGQTIVREIVYRVLCGSQSAALRAVALQEGHVSQIGKILRRIHADYADPLDVEMLARDAGMSVSTFHAAFKTVTSTSPLQYIKRIRLHKARVLLLQRGLSAGAAASAVGYESGSQFSREFKRFFGTTPIEEATRLRVVVA